MIAALLFIAKHLLVLAVVLLAAAGAGTLVVGSRDGLALRSALGLALWGQALFLLALIGQLCALPILVLTIVAIVGGAMRGRLALRGISIVTAAVSCAAFLVALRPPLAFDETLYHLPHIRALAASGQLHFLADSRFPVFPQLHELLCVPVFLAAGDVATHLVSLLEVFITAALLFEWGRRYTPNAGALAAALFVGSPIVVHLATISHVEAALTLFVTTGFYCLDRAQFEDRRWLVLSGLFFGTACSVKYLGGFFAVAALLIVAVHLPPRRTAVFAVCCAAAALPTTLWLIATTGNPVFPFLPQIFGGTPWSMSLRAETFGRRVIDTLRLVYDVTFARDRVNHQPPITPFLAVAIVAVLAATVRDVRARWVALIVAAYVVVFSFLHQDSRYLVPLLPLVSIVAAVVFTRPSSGLRPPSPRKRGEGQWALIAVAPGILYAVYVLAARGLPPFTAAEREEFLARRVPEYTALMRAGRETVYVCGGEQLKYYAGGTFLGDLTGLYSYDRVLAGARSTSAIAANLRRIGAHDFLVAKRVCAPPQADGGMDLVYEDAGAQLWRVQRTQSSP